MKLRSLGKKGPEVSEIGLGCWQLGADWGDPVSEETGMKILATAVAQGVTLFDTADVYGQGKSESLIGKFLRTTDTPLTVITKYGRGNGIYPDNYTEKNLNEAIEGSLERLGVKSLDLLQLHCIPQEILEKGLIFKWLVSIKKNGLIKNFGASVETIEQGILCMEQEELLSLQVIFNIFRQRLIDELFPRAEESGTGIIVRLPLASGLLSGKFSKETYFAPNDHRNFNRDGQVFNVGETFAGLPYGKGLELVDVLKKKFVSEQIPMAQFALRWILDHKAVSTVIPGASKAEQVLSNAAASDLEAIEESQHQALYEFYRSDIDQYIRGAY